MSRRAALAGIVAIVAVVVVVIALGSSGGASNRSAQRLDLMLDFFPNADHSPIYAAQAGGGFRHAGLDVRLRAPSDPSVPLELLAAGKVDLAISYEPELLLARQRGLPVVGVGALVRVPLTTVISLPRSDIATPRDLAGKRVATAGISYQDAYLTAILRRAGVPRSDVRERDVGFDLLPALLGGQADAVLGGYWNYEAIQLSLEGRHPRVLRIERAGVPTYDELVISARESTLRRDPGLVRRFLAALASGAHELARDPRPALAALLGANRDLDARLQQASEAATLPYFLPESGRPYGYMDPVAWTRFATFMQQSGVLSPRVRATSAMTDAFLPR